MIWGKFINLRRKLIFLTHLRNSSLKVYGLQALHSLTKSPSTRTGFESEVNLFLHTRCFFLKGSKDSFNYVKVISCLHTLLVSYRLCGDHQKAIAIWKENTLPVYEKQLGDHPWTASILSYIADSYKSLAAKGSERNEQDYIDQAEKYLRKAQELRKKLLGHHQDTARSGVQLSDVLFLQGRFDEALKELDEALVIQNDILGPDHKITKDTVSKRSDVIDKRGSNPR